MWDSSLSLPGLIVNGRIVVDGVVRLLVRRFRCPNAPCPRKTFSESLAPTVGRRYGRSIARCDALLRAVALVLGGSPGSRMMERLALRWSRDTMLRVLGGGDPMAEVQPP